MFMVYGKDIRYTTLESIEAEFAPGGQSSGGNS
jgi:hypothetical protein